MHCTQDFLRCIYLFLLKRYAHGIFATGWPNVPTQQKKPVATNAMHLQSNLPSQVNRKWILPPFLLILLIHTKDKDNKMKTLD